MAGRTKWNKLLYFWKRNKVQPGTDEFQGKEETDTERFRLLDLWPGKLGDTDRRLNNITSWKRHIFARVSCRLRTIYGLWFSPHHCIITSVSGNFLNLSRRYESMVK